MSNAEWRQKIKQKCIGYFVTDPKVPRALPGPPHSRLKPDGRQRQARFEADGNPLAPAKLRFSLKIAKESPRLPDILHYVRPRRGIRVLAGAEPRFRVPRNSKL